MLVPLIAAAWVSAMSIAACLCRAAKAGDAQAIDR
jgi:hypothetical protein